MGIITTGESIPTSDKDTYPLLDNKYIRGSLHNVQTYQEMVDTPLERKSEGMFFYVVSDDILYKYVNGEYKEFGVDISFNPNALTKNIVISGEYIIPARSINEYVLIENDESLVNGGLLVSRSGEVNSVELVSPSVRNGSLYVKIINHLGYDIDLNGSKLKYIVYPYLTDEKGLIRDIIIQESTIIKAKSTQSIALINNDTGLLPDGNIYTISGEIEKLVVTNPLVKGASLYVNITNYSLYDIDINGSKLRYLMGQNEDDRPVFEGDIYEYKQVDKTYNAVKEDFQPTTNVVHGKREYKFSALVLDSSTTPTTINLDFLKNLNCTFIRDVVSLDFSYGGKNYFTDVYHIGDTYYNYTDKVFCLALQGLPDRLLKYIYITLFVTFDDDPDIIINEELIQQNIYDTTSKVTYTGALVDEKPVQRKLFEVIDKTVPFIIKNDLFFIIDKVVNLNIVQACEPLSTSDIRLSFNKYAELILSTSDNKPLIFNTKLFINLEYILTKVNFKFIKEVPVTKNSSFPTFDGVCYFITDNNLNDKFGKIELYKDSVLLDVAYGKYDGNNSFSFTHQDRYYMNADCRNDADIVINNLNFEGVNKFRFYILE